MTWKVPACCGRLPWPIAPRCVVARLAASVLAAKSQIRRATSRTWFTQQRRTRFRTAPREPSSRVLRARPQHLVDGSDIQAARREQYVQVIERRSAASSTTRSSLSSSAATATSTASSPTLRAQRATPSSSSSTVYEPAGLSAARARRPCARGRGRSRRACRCGTQARRCDADGGARRRRSRPELVDRERVARRSRPYAKAAGGSGSRTRPRRSRA